MNDHEFLKYFDSEMRWLKSAAREFAEQHPDNPPTTAALACAHPSAPPYECTPPVHRYALDGSFFDHNPDSINELPEAMAVASSG